MKREKSKKIIFNFLLLIALSLGMFFIIYKKTNPRDLKAVFFAIDKKYIFYAIVAFLLFRYMEALSIYVLLRKVEQKTSIKACIDYSVFGYFFSQLTPSGGGGQPGQLYLMSKDGISGDKALAAIAPFNVMYHFTLSIFGIISLTTDLRYIILDGNLKVFFYLGILVQILLAIGVIFVIKKDVLLTNFLIFLSERTKKIKILSRFYKSPEYIRNFVENLRNNISNLRENKSNYIIIFVFQTLMLFFYYSVAYFTYKGLGFLEFGILDIVRIQCLVIIATEYIPTPGTAGFSELALYEVYKQIVDNDFALTWMMINRLLLLYLAIIVAILLFLLRKINKKHKVN